MNSPTVSSGTPSGSLPVGLSTEDLRGTPTSNGGPSLGGRASAFREQQTHRRSERREQIGSVIVVAIIVLALYTIVTARPPSPSTLGSPFPPGAPITIILGTPSANNTTCGDGSPGYVERVPWTNASGAVTTGDLNVRLFEIWDGDFLGDPGVVANATPTNVCAGSPPSPSPRWYVVLQAPNGTNLLTYTDATDWVAIGPGPWNIGIENGSALLLVTDASLAGSGRGLSVFGYANGAPIQSTVAL
jgi:hypothetical protein